MDAPRAPLKVKVLPAGVQDLPLHNRLYKLFARLFKLKITAIVPMGAYA
jgi:hypothetical protein